MSTHLTMQVDNRSEVELDGIRVRGRRIKYTIYSHGSRRIEEKVPAGFDIPTDHIEATFRGHKELIGYLLSNSVATEREFRVTIKKVEIRGMKQPQRTIWKEVFLCVLTQTVSRNAETTTVFLETEAKPGQLARIAF